LSRKLPKKVFKRQNYRNRFFEEDGFKIAPSYEFFSKMVKINRKTKNYLKMNPTTQNPTHLF